MSVFDCLKSLGVEDIRITAIDNLNGFTQTIRSVFPEFQTQICIAHQIINTCKYVVWKDRNNLLNLAITVLNKFDDSIFKIIILNIDKNQYLFTHICLKKERKR